MERLPLIFVHLGNAPYLLYCLWQARASNPGSEIVLIGDRSNRRYGEFLTHCLADNCISRAREFAAVLEHGVSATTAAKRMPP